MRASFGRDLLEYHEPSTKPSTEAVPYSSYPYSVLRLHSLRFPVAGAQRIFPASLKIVGGLRWILPSGNREHQAVWSTEMFVKKSNNATLRTSPLPSFYYLLARIHLPRLHVAMHVAMCLWCDAHILLSVITVHFSFSHLELSLLLSYFLLVDFW